MYTVIKRTSSVAVLSMASWFIGSSVFGETMPSHGFDFAAINQNLATATSEAIAGNALVQQLAFHLDPAGTDLDKDYLERATITLRLARTPWSNNPVQAKRSIALRVLRSSDKGYLEMSTKGHVHTDGLALVKYMARTKWAKCPGDSDLSGVGRIYYKHGCALAKEVQAAGDLKTIADSMRTRLAETAKDLADFANAARNDLVHAQNALLKEENKKVLDKVLRQVNEINSLKIVETNAGIAISSDVLRLGGDIEMKNFRMLVTPKGAAMTFAVKAPIDLRIYDALKPELVHMLRGLEQGKEFAVEHVRAKTRIMTRLLNDFATGQMAPVFLDPASPEDARVTGVILGALLANATT